MEISAGCRRTTEKTADFFYGLPLLTTRRGTTSEPQQQTLRYTDFDAEQDQSAGCRSVLRRRWEANS